MNKHIDISGKKFGRLKVLRLSHTSPRSDHGGLNYYYLCQCECGNKHIARSKDLGNGTSSCGCFRKEFLKKSHTIHGFKYTTFYRKWSSIKNRCYNKKVAPYKNYGGRGIIMSEEWKNFINFKKDMYISYLYHCKKYGKENTSIERIDNNGNYCKKNCKWATRKEQARNKRKIKMIIYKNKIKSLSEWCEIFNLNYPTLRYRIKSGWNSVKALTTPIIKK